MSEISAPSDSSPTESIRSLLARVGAALLQTNRSSSAVARLREALAEPGNDPPASTIHHLLGRSLEAGAPRDSFRHYLQAIELGAPEAEEGSIVIDAARAVRELVRAGKVTPSNTDVKRLRATDPTAIREVADDVALLSGLLNLEIGRPEEAVKDLRRAMGGNVELEAHLALATAKEQLGESGRSDLEQALRLVGDDRGATAEIHVRLANIDLADGLPKRALEHLDALTNDTPASLVLRASALLADGDPLKALELVEAIDSVEALRLTIQARLAMRHEEHTEAIDAQIVAGSNELLQRDPLGADSTIVRAQALIETTSNITEGRRLLRTVSTTLAASEQIPRALHCAELGRPEGDYRFTFFLAEVYASMAEAGDDFTKPRHLAAARTKLDQFLDEIESADQQSSPIPLGSLMRLNAELRRGELPDEGIIELELRATDALLDDSDFAGAVALMETSIVRGLKNAEAAWLLSEAIRLDASVRSSGGESVDELLKRSAYATIVWDEQFMVDRPHSEHSWAYAARSLVAMQRSAWSSYPVADIWEAICFQQVAVMVDPTAGRFTQLAQLLRWADLDVCSLHAATRAYSLEQSAANLIEVLVGRVNTGDLDGAMSATADLRLQPGDDELFTVADIDELDAQLNRIRGRPEDLEHAAQLVDAVLAEDDTRTRSLVLRAELSEIRGTGDGTADWARAVELTVGAPAEENDDLAGALLHLGRAEEARNVAAEAIDGGALASESLWRWLGLADLALGNPGGAQILEQWASQCRATDLVQGVVDYEIPRLRRMSPNTNLASILDVVVSNLVSTLERLRARPPEPDGELAAFDRLTGPPEAVPWHTLCSAFTRLQIGDLNPDAPPTLDGLERLQHELTGVPSELAAFGVVVARTAIRKLQFEALCAEITADEVDAATAHKTAMSILADEDMPSTTTLAVAAFTSFNAGDEIGGAELLESSIDHGGKAIDIGRTWATLLSRPRRFVDAIHWLAQLSDADRNNAELAVAKGLNRLLGLETQAESSWRSIGLDLGDNLLPDDPYDPSWPFVAEWIPEMKTELYDQYGVALPGVNCSRNDVPDEFVIRIDEGLVGRWKILESGGFLVVPPEQLAAAGVGADDVVPIDDPFTGAPASWLKTVDVTTEFGAPDSLRLVVRQLGAVLRRHLGRFVRIDQIHRLAGEEGIELAHDELLSVRDIAVSLVDDRVPLRPIAPLISALASSGGDSHGSILEDVRLALVDRLPGNQGERLVPLPNELEEAMMRGEVPDAAAIALILGNPGGLDRTTRVDGQPVVLVCRQSGVRRALQRLISASSPDLLLIAEAEVLK